MAIATSDLLMKFSTTSGSAGSSTAGTAIASLGKYMSTTTWGGSVLNDLFPDLSAAENLASQIDYRCVFLYNNHATLTLSNTVIYISNQVSGGTSIAIGLDPVGVVDYNTAGVQAATIANTTTAPAGVTFSAPSTSGTGLSIGSFAAQKCIGVWVRRTAANTGAVSADGATIQVLGESPP